MATGSENTSKVIVSFNDSIEEAVTVDQLSPPDLNQQNVFFAEEAERKLIVAHSVHLRFYLREATKGTDFQTMLMKLQ
jgi:hypothetical protein